MKVHTYRATAYVLLAAVFSVSMLVRAVTAQSGVAPPEAVLPAPLLAEYKVSLRFLQKKVAVGAIANPAHQAPFEILVTDQKNRPQAGVPVALPVIVQGGCAAK